MTKQISLIHLKTPRTTDNWGILPQKPLWEQGCQQ